MMAAVVFVPEMRSSGSSEWLAAHLQSEKGVHPKSLRLRGHAY